MATVIPVTPWSASAPEISSLLTKNFPDVTSKTIGEYFCAAARSKTVGATIQIRYDTVTVKGGFPSFLGQAAFSALVVGLGVIPPLIVYYFAFHRKMKKFEKEIAECIRGDANERGTLRTGTKE